VVEHISNHACILGRDLISRIPQIQTKVNRINDVLNEIAIEIEQYYKQTKEINNIELEEVKKQIENSEVKVNSHSLMVFPNKQKKYQQKTVTKQKSCHS